jgi:hypothetical protein
MRLSMFAKPNKGMPFEFLLSLKHRPHSFLSNHVDLLAAKIDLGYCASVKPEPLEILVAKRSGWVELVG